MAVGAVTDIREILLIHYCVVHIYKNAALFRYLAWVGTFITCSVMRDPYIETGCRMLQQNGQSILLLFAVPQKHLAPRQMSPSPAGGVLDEQLARSGWPLSTWN